MRNKPPARPECAFCGQPISARHGRLQFSAPPPPKNSARKELFLPRDFHPVCFEAWGLALAAMEGER